MAPRPSSKKRKRREKLETGEGSSRLGGHGARRPKQQEVRRQGQGTQEPGLF
jgi:hypothetical protein